MLRALLRPICAIVSVLLLSGATSAQGRNLPTVEAPAAPIHPRYIYVPADHVEAWPRGDWAPIHSSELRNLLFASPQPPAAYLETLTYRGRLSGETLEGGTLEGTASADGSETAFIDLGKPSLAISNLAWEEQEEEAVWGTAPSGQLLLRVAPGQTSLKGRWSLNGRAQFDRTIFDVEVPQAIVSTFILEVPESLQLTTDPDVVAESISGAQAGWKTWTIHMGRRSSCRLAVSQEPAEKSQRTREIVASQTAAYTFLPDSVRFQVDVALLSATGRFDALEFIVPQRLQVLSLTTGKDVVLPSSRSEEGQNSILSVDVTNVELELGVTVRIRGQLPVRLGRPQTLPKFGLRECRWVRLVKEVSISRELEMRDFFSQGSRLVDASIGPDTGAVMRQEDLLPSSRTQVTVDAPQPEIAARVRAEAHWGLEDPVLRTQLRLESRSGSTFLLQCQVPGGWEVSRVHSVGAAPVAQWRTFWSEAEQQSRLEVELSRPLTTQEPIELVVSARRSTRLESGTVDLPAILPLVAGSRAVTAVISPPPESEFALPPDSALKQIARDAFDSSFPEYSGLMTEHPEADWHIFGVDDPPELPVLLFLQHESGDAGSFASSLVTTSSSVRGGAELATAETPLMMSMQLRTLVEAGRGGRCRHRATLEVPPLRTPRELQLSLPEEVRLVSVTGGTDTRIEEHNVTFQLDASANPRRISLLYDSPLKQSLLTGGAKVPLPRWNGRTTTVGWEIILPDHYRLRSTTNGSTAHSERELGWSHRFFGPLGSSTFNAGGATLFASTATSENSLNLMPVTEASSAIRKRSVVGEVEHLQLTFWNVAAAYHLGWVVLLFSFVISAWPSQTERWIPQWVQGSAILTGAAAALIAPEYLAIPVGGFLSGTLLGTLLPDRWRRLPLRKRERDQVTSPSSELLRISALTAIVVAVGAGYVETSAADDPPLAKGPAGGSVAPASFDVLVPLRPQGQDSQFPEIVYVDRQQVREVLQHRLPGRPASLIRAATYQIEALGDSPSRLTAFFQVLLLRPQSETAVPLELTDVTFPATPSCTIDGTPGDLYPIEAGQGIVVVIPPRDRSPDEGVVAVEIRIPCATPPATSSAGPRLDVGIPTVLNSRAEFRVGSPAAPAIRVSHSGAAMLPMADGRWRVELGSQSRLVAHPDDESGDFRWALPVEAASVVEVHPLRLQVESQLRFRTDPQWARLARPTLILELPGQSIVRSIRAEGLAQFFTRTTHRQITEVSLEFEDVPQSELAVSLSFDIVNYGRGGETTVTVPPLNFVSGPPAQGFPVHLVGASATSGFEFAASDPEGMLPGTTGIDESRLPPWRGVANPRTADATYRLTVPRPIELPLLAVEPERLAALQQSLEIQDSSLEWELNADVTVRRAPVALHRFDIDPRITVRDASILQSGIERLATWSRTRADEIVLLMTEELSGPQSIRLTGSLTVDERRDFLSPVAALQNSRSTQPPTLRVRKSPALTVRVSSRGETVMSSVQHALPTQGGLVDVGTIPLDADGEQSQIRIAGSDRVTQLERMTVIRSTPEGERSVSLHNRLLAGEEMPAEMAIRVEGASDVSLKASVPLELVEDSESSKIWVMQTDGLQSRFVDVVATSALRDPSSLPDVRIDDTVLKHHAVVLGDEVGLHVANGTSREINRGNLSAWMLTQLQQFETANPMLVSIDEMSAILTESEAADDRAEWQRVESVIWAGEAGRWHGLTYALTRNSKEGSIDFTLPTGLTVDLVTRNGDPASPGRENDVLRLPMPASEAPVSLMLWWKAPRSDAGVVRLPAPVMAEGTPHHVAVLAGRTRYVNVTGAEPVVQENLSVDPSTAMDGSPRESPLARVLSDAGVSRSFVNTEVPLAELSVHRLLPGSSTISVRIVEREVLRMMRLIIGAGLAVCVWFALGGWIVKSRSRWGARVELTAMWLFALAVLLIGSRPLGGALLLAITLAWWVHPRQSRSAEPAI